MVLNSDRQLLKARVKNVLPKQFMDIYLGESQKYYGEGVLEPLSIVNH